MMLKRINKHNKKTLTFYTPGFTGCTCKMKKSSLKYQRAWVPDSAAVLPVLWCGCSAAGSRCAPVSLSLHSVPLYSDIPAAFEWSTDIFRDHWVIFALRHIYEHVQQDHRKSVGRTHYINLISPSHVYQVVFILCIWQKFLLQITLIVEIFTRSMKCL